MGLVMLMGLVSLQEEKKTQSSLFWLHCSSAGGLSDPQCPHHHQSNYYYTHLVRFLCGLHGCSNHILSSESMFLGGREKCFPSSTRPQCLAPWKRAFMSAESVRAGQCWPSACLSIRICACVALPSVHLPRMDLQIGKTAG